MRRVIRALRRSGVVAHPLRRPVDRVEGWVTLILVVVFAVFTPLAAAAVGGCAFRAGVRAEQSQEADRRHVMAKIVKEGGRESRRLVAVARWRGSDGMWRMAKVPVNGGHRPGSSVRLWIDQSGREVAPPRTRAQTWNQALSYCLITMAGIGFLLLEVRRAVRLRLDRRRSERWERLWAEIEPPWSTRHRPPPPWP
ncbi:hypothetical protein [Actinomadura sp. NPDC048394]|uniref:Rv1733c family protein n=1 Tax=Actinomadura sp. NPDC048394 TaxID=3158223 RepID=UPI0033E70623